MKLGLENIRRLFATLGNPQDNYLKVQIAGTNGKGSVCAFLDSICNAAGIGTGTFTSPHLISITERIKINGRDISENDFARHATLVRETAENLLVKGALEYCPTFFEQVTAIALIAFSEAKIELAILETGLGGRLDATTAANAEIAAITRIDLDHQEYLGNTIEEIAAEKAAIIQPHTNTVVIGEQNPEAMAVIEKRIREIKGETTNGSEFVVHRTSCVEKSFEPVPFPASKLGLVGGHQIENSKIAIMLAASLDPRFEITDEHILNGLERTRHPGRLEYYGKYLFDGAHNVNGAIALVMYLIMNEPRPVTLLFGAMTDKSVAEILAIIAWRAERIVFTEPANPRALSYDDLLRQLPADMSRERTFATDTVAKAISIAETVTPDDGIILVTGSLYLVGEAKGLIQAASR